MNDLQRDKYRRSRSSSEHSPMPPRSRSERVGPRSRSGRGAVKKKQGLARFFNFKWLMLVLLTSVLLAVGGCSAIMLSTPMRDLGKIEEIDFSSTLFAADGKTVIGKIGDKREYISIEEINKHNPDLPKAFVKVEDERFYEHSGVDYYGLARAIVTNIIEMRNAQGASTITMQVAGNIVLEDRDKNYTRKLNEAAAAFNLERNFGKDKILEAYLNYIYLGNDVHGVQMASKIYFGKDLKTDKLEPHEIAFLAGLPKAPSTYNPYGNEKQRQKAKERRNVALLQMSKDNSTPPLITEEEKEKYQQMPIPDPEDGKKFKEKYLKTQKYDAYKDLVKKELKDRYDITDDDLASKGYKIVTGIDPKAQDAVEAALKDQNQEIFTGDQLDAGVTLIEPQTGRILAVGGGRKFKTGFMNRSVQIMQPGSTIKPLTVFAPAVELLGYNEYTPYKDEPYNIGEYEPKNYSKRYYGDVTLKEMVYRSLNVSTVKLLYEEVKLNRAFNYAKELGLPVVNQDKGPAALGLGGMHHGVSTKDMAQAYTVFPNWGKMTQAHTVIKVEKANGEEYKPKEGKEINAKGNPKEVFKPQTAYYTHRMLREVVEHPSGTGSNAKFGRQPVAGKTGTTQRAQEAWFVGYTPDIVGAVAIFNDGKGEGIELKSSTSAKLFSNIMSQYLGGKVTEFKKPPGVKEPEKPFELEAPRVKGNYDQDEKAVILKWQQQKDRVRYQVLRRSENETEFQVIQELPPGSIGYKDGSIQVPESDGLFGGWFGERQETTYYYKVIAIDTQAENEDFATKESEEIKVKVKPKKEKKKEDEDKDNGDGDNNDDGSGGDGNDGDRNDDRNQDCKKEFPWVPCEDDGDSENNNP